MSLYFAGLSPSLMMAILIFLLFWSEAVRQALMWIDDKNELFNPWIKNSKRLKFITWVIPDEAYDDHETYFIFFCSFILPIVLLLLISLWPITLMFFSASFLVNKARDRKRAKKNENT